MNHADGTDGTAGPVTTGAAVDRGKQPVKTGDSVDRGTQHITIIQSLLFISGK